MPNTLFEEQFELENKNEVATILTNKWVGKNLAYDELYFLDRALKANKPFYCKWFYVEFEKK